jgi:hypothetical protein
MEHPPIFAFTDCRDENTLARLSARLTALFEDSSIHCFGIDTDIEASGCILDTLDALRPEKRISIIIGNLAPRTEKRHKNGAPFYVGKVGNTIIVATKTCFSLLNKFGLISEIGETDVETVCRKFLPEDEALRIANSQFRSFEYLPLLAKWAYEEEEIPQTLTALEEINENKIWWIDNFGNSKTTLTEKEIKERVVDGKVACTINGTIHTLPFFQRLADVPKGEKAITIGSSGYKDTRFAEIVVQGFGKGIFGADIFGVKTGDIIE